MKTFNVSFPSDLVERIDEAAKLNYETRSEYLKRAAFQRLKAESTTVDGAPRPKTLAELQREKLKAFLSQYTPDDFEVDVE